ncbi:MAG TPA: nuclear transport factor 2 family protein [Jatrophihabitans sp.]|nr:nuclear transport factor 2 family protein [Jatrophihabitans sp.]
MPDPSRSVLDYIASWNETDPVRRAELIAAVWREDGRYVDSATEARGRPQIEAMIAAVQRQLPGNAFSLVGQVEFHHDVARFCWQLGPAGGPPLLSGLDVAVFDPDGRLHQLVGFWDQPAPAEQEPP